MPESPIPSDSTESAASHGGRSPVFPDGSGSAPSLTGRVDGESAALPPAHRDTTGSSRMPLYAPASPALPPGYSAYYGGPTYPYAAAQQYYLPPTLFAGSASGTPTPQQAALFYAPYAAGSFYGNVPYYGSSSSGSASGARTPSAGTGTFGYACDRCREKHQSCDHEKPCKRCIKANVAAFCHYTPKRARGARNLEGGAALHSPDSGAVANSSGANAASNRAKRPSQPRIVRKKSTAHAENGSAALPFHTAALSYHTSAQVPFHGAHFPATFSNTAYGAMPYGSAQFGANMPLPCPAGPAALWPSPTNALHMKRPASAPASPGSAASPSAASNWQHPMATLALGAPAGLPPLPALVDALHYKASAAAALAPRPLLGNVVVEACDHSLPGTASEHRLSPSETPRAHSPEQPKHGPPSFVGTSTASPYQATETAYSRSNFSLQNNLPFSQASFYPQTAVFSRAAHLDYDALAAFQQDKLEERRLSDVSGKLGRFEPQPAESPAGNADGASDANRLDSGIKDSPTTCKKNFDASALLAAGILVQESMRENLAAATATECLGFP
jgi:hypothetical protein